MGGGRGGRGSSGKGKGKGNGNDSKASWSPSKQDWDEDGDWDSWQQDAWQDNQTHSPSGRRVKPDSSYSMNESTAWPDQNWQGSGDAANPRPLAAQWRFVCRILQRHAAEERLHDPKREIRLGDHVFVRYTWDFEEQHAIVCSSTSDDNRGRRNDREDPHWVVHWSQESNRLECTALGQFSKGGDLFRVPYPHWVCQCYVPSSTTTKPQISDEYQLEADRPDAVAAKANKALKNGTWAPCWSQAADLEFCIQTKTTSDSIVEIHSRKTLSSATQWPLGCSIGSDRKPSVLFGVGKSGGAGSRGAAGAPPGYSSAPPKPAMNRGQEVPWSQPQMPAMPAFGGWEGEPGWGWQAPPIAAPMMAAPMGMGAPLGIAAALQSSTHVFSGASADAQEFVPGHVASPSLSDMIYQ